MSKSERRSVLKEYVESAAVFIQLSSFYLAPILGPILTIYLLFYTRLWSLVLAYFIFMYLDQDTPFTHGRSRKWMRNLFLWTHFRDYFPQTMVKTSELDLSSNHIFCLFPHGVLATSLFSHFTSDTSPVSEYFPTSTYFGITLDLNFYIPFFREIVLGYGTKSVSKRSIINQLTGTKGVIMSMYPGGSAEASKSHPGTYRIAIKNRKGFVKLAIVTGTNLVPVIAFGETDLYDTWVPSKGSLFEKIFVYVRKKTGVAPCILSGRGFLRILPYRKPVTSVVGTPLIITKNENPSNEEVNRTHSEFLASLVKLFEEHKGKYLTNPESTFLTIED